MITEMLTASLLGAMLCLDDLVIGRFMLSMPIVTAPLVGWALGDPQAGVAVGCLWQLIWVGQMPIGVQIPPSSPAMAVMGAAFAALLGRVVPGHVPFEAVIVFSLLAALPLSQLSGAIDFNMRKRNQFYARAAEKSAENGSLRSVIPMIAHPIAAALVKNTVFFFISMVSLQALLALLLGVMPWPILHGLKTAYFLVPVIGFAVVFHLFTRKDHLVPIGISFLASMLFLFVFKVNEGVLLTAAVLTGVMIGVVRYVFVRRAQNRQEGS